MKIMSRADLGLPVCQDHETEHKKQDDCHLTAKQVPGADQQEEDYHDTNAKADTIHLRKQRILGSLELLLTHIDDEAELRLVERKTQKFVASLRAALLAGSDPLQHQDRTPSWAEKSGSRSTSAPSSPVVECVTLRAKGLSLSLELARRHQHRHSTFNHNLPLSLSLSNVIAIVIAISSSTTVAVAVAVASGAFAGLVCGDDRRAAAATTAGRSLSSSAASTTAFPIHHRLSAAASTTVVIVWRSYQPSARFVRLTRFLGVAGRRKEKLRRLNWEKVPDGKVEGTIFADIHNSGSGTTAVAARTPKRVAFLSHRRKSKSAAAKAEAGDLHSSCGGGGSGEVEIDIEALTDLFALKNNASTSSSSSSATNKKRPELQRTQSEILFDPKKSRNIEIIMKRGSLRADGIRNAVMAFQLAGDDLDSARSLLATFPSQAELRVLMSYGGEPGQLAPSERLFRDVMDVSFIEQRLLATAFKTEFASLVGHVEATLGAANAAVDKVQGCVQLKRLLKWVLALGNAMNDGYFGAQAKAFSLSSLLKLADVRDTKGRGTNLLAHLLRQVEDKEPGLLDTLRLELAPVLSASLRERLNVAADEAHMLSNGLRQIEEFICEIAPKSAADDSLTTANGDGAKKKKKKASKLMGSLKSPVALTKQRRNKKAAAAAANKINRAEAEGEPEDRFYAAAKAFVEEARPVVSRLQREADECVARFAALSAYLCEAPDTDVLRILHDFCHQLESVKAKTTNQRR